MAERRQSSGSRRWRATVLASALIVALVALAIGVGWLASLRTHTATYSVPAPVSRVDLVLRSGRATIVGTSSPELQVRRTDRYSFGHPAREHRWVESGVLHISSRCPRIVLGSCSASYELAVPDGVAVDVQSYDGDVRMTGFNGNAVVRTDAGNVDVEAFCGFHLSARSHSGDIDVSTACAPQTLDLSTVTGNAAAFVPRGRYRIVEDSGTGREHLGGVLSDPNAPFAIDVASSLGSVAVDGGL